MADYTVDELFGKLERADAAGDAEAATVIADEIRRLQGQQKPRRSVRGGASMAGSLDMPNVEGKNVAPKPKGNAVTRFLGEIGARNVMQGAYGTYGALGGDALNEYVLAPVDRAIGWGDQLGVGDRTYRQAASDQADEWGMAKPQTPSQRVVADVGEALSGNALTLGVGGLLGLGRQAVSTAAPTVRSKLADFLTTQPTLQYAASATGAGAQGVTRESGGGTGAQLLAGLAGTMAPGVASYTGAAGLRGLVRGRDGAQMRQTIDDFGELSATPSVGQASGRRTVQGFENVLSGLPLGEAPIADFATRQADDIGAGLERLAGGLSPRYSAEDAGRAIEKGVSTYQKNVSAMRKALYWKVDQMIPRGTTVQLPNTWRAMVDLTTPVRGAEATTGALVNPTISAMRNNLSQDLARGGGNLPYEALKDLRSRIGRELDGSLLVTDKPMAEYKELYKALSQDMEAAARAHGPAAAQAARRANNYTRLTTDRLEDLQRIIDKNGGPEKVYQSAIGGIRDGGTTVRKLMRSIDHHQQRTVTAAVIRRMGLANPGAQDATGDVFSAQTFLTNWNKVSPEAKRALFDRHGPQFVRDMDRVAKVAQNIRDGSKVFANPSGTGPRTLATGYLIALFGALGVGRYKTAAGLAAYGGMTHSVASAMTNPRVVKWLANSTALPPSTTPAQIQALRRIGEQEEDEDIVALADTLADEVANQ